MKIFSVIALIILVLGTALISIKKPPMHTRILIYDSQYTIVDEDSSSKPVEKVVEEKNMPSMPVVNDLTKEEIVFSNETKPTVVQTVKTTEPSKTKTNKVQTQTKQEPKTTTTETKTPTTKNVVPIQTVTTTPTQTVTQTSQNPNTVKVLTEKEEEIAWNIWRSNLQNQILKDAKLPVIPIGTVFKVSFDVDKNGRITNIQTYSTDPRYTPYAIEYVAPVIRGYQGKPIVEFPAGSQRTSTTFTGSWKIAQSAKYSNPNDYNDYERVKK